MNKMHVWMTAIFFSLAVAGFSMGCGVDIVSSDCTTDEACVEQTDGEYATCGNSETADGVCCKAGTMKCPCLEDNTCVGDLVCFDQDMGGDIPKGKFCNAAFAESFGGLERVE